MRRVAVLLFVGFGAEVRDLGQFLIDLGCWAEQRRME